MAFYFSLSIPPPLTLTCRILVNLEYSSFLECLVFCRCSNGPWPGTVRRLQNLYFLLCEDFITEL